MSKSKTLIAIPVYNAESYIGRTLNSCMNQTLKSQIYVIDNSSEDNTQEIVKKYINQFDNIKLIVNEKNCGRIGNWNKCLEHFMQSEYEYIKFVFSGDEILPECIEEGEKAFTIDSEIGAIAFPYEFINLDGKVTISRHDECPNRLFSAKEITYKNLAEGMLLGAIICNIYSKKAIQDFRFDENLVSKAKFDIEVLENFKAYYLDKVLARFHLDAHNTFDSANSIAGFMEFSCIESKELQRISKTSKFEPHELEEIKQKIILNCITHQLTFMTIGTGLNSVIRILSSTLNKIIKRIISGK